jgi:hypothetical protein
MADAKPKNRLLVKREKREERDKCMKKFINGLTKLATAAFSKNKKDDDFRRRYDEYNLAKKDAPEEVMRMAGPPIWAHRENIMAGNIDVFLKADYKDDIIKFADHVPDADFIEDEQILINKIKRTWHLFTPIEQEKMLSNVQELVSLYANYIKIERELEKLESE